MLPELAQVLAAARRGRPGRSFTTVSPPRPATRRARTTTPAWFSCEVGRVEEEHLPDLRLERIEPERGDRGAVLASGSVTFSSTVSAPLQRASRSVVELVAAKAR